MMPVGKIRNVGDNRVVIGSTAAVTHTNGFIANLAQANKIISRRCVADLYQAVRLIVTNKRRVKADPAGDGTCGSIDIVGYRIDINIIVAAVKFKGAVDIAAFSLPQRPVS